MVRLYEVGHCKDCCIRLRSTGHNKCNPNSPLIIHLKNEHCPFCKDDPETEVSSTK